VDVVDASHMNDLQNEVAAIEAALGLNPGGGAIDLATRVATLETGKATLTHDHTNRLDAVGHDVTTRHAFGAALGTPVAPSTWSLGAAASAGSGTRPAREDHAHGVPADISSSVIPPGSILAYGGVSAPTGWLLCNGAWYSTGAYPALFAAIGYNYGGSGGTFYVPDLQGRTIVGAGSGLGRIARTVNSNAWGGVERVTLSVSQLPAHSHTGGTGSHAVSHSHGDSHLHGINNHATAHYAKVANNPGGGDDQGYPAFNNHVSLRSSDRPQYGGVYVLFGSDVLNTDTKAGTTDTNGVSHTHAVFSEGNNNDHDNMPPFHVATYIIKV
jgi:microcystin-dependent protein